MGEDGVLTYVNSKTGETTTEKPPFFAGGDESGWVKVQGPDGEWVYINTETGETSTEEPDGWTGSDWVTVVNEDGSLSYVSTKTGETTDEKPMELQDMEGEWIAVMGEDGTISYVNSKTGETTTVQPPFFAGGDDSGWVKVQGPDGEWVYVNTETGETSTTEPLDWTGSDWVTVVNEDGSVSYVNTKTGETTDEKPMELQARQGRPVKKNWNRKMQDADTQTDDSLDGLKTALASKSVEEQLVISVDNIEQTVQLRGQVASVAEAATLLDISFDRCTCEVNGNGRLELTSDSTGEMSTVSISASSGANAKGLLGFPGNHYDGHQGPPPTSGKYVGNESVMFDFSGGATAQAPTVKFYFIIIYF
jgi:arginine repressor